jgi:hypothetical protein
LIYFFFIALHYNTRFIRGSVPIKGCFVCSLSFFIQFYLRAYLYTNFGQCQRYSRWLRVVIEKEDVLTLTRGQGCVRVFGNWRRVSQGLLSALRLVHASSQLDGHQFVLYSHCITRMCCTHQCSRPIQSSRLCVRHIATDRNRMLDFGLVKQWTDLHRNKT